MRAFKRYSLRETKRGLMCATDGLFRIRRVERSLGELNIPFLMEKPTWERREFSMNSWTSRVGLNYCSPLLWHFESCTSSLLFLRAVSIMKLYLLRSERGDPVSRSVYTRHEVQRSHFTERCTWANGARDTRGELGPLRHLLLESPFDRTIRVFPHQRIWFIASPRWSLIISFGLNLNMNCLPVFALV